MKLKDIQCKNAKPKEKPYKLGDGAGMYLEIMPNGSKYWRLKYRALGKEKRLALGVYPSVSLSEAREKRDEAKKLIREGIDPVQSKRKSRKEAMLQSENTFKAVALEWHELNKDRWSEGYAQKMMRILTMNLFPYLGDEPISQIKPPDLLDVLRKVEKRGALEIASKTKQIAGRVFCYGIQTGKCEWNAADNLTGALKVNKTEHFRTLDVKQVPDFLKALERNEARLFERTRRALWLSLYTFCRPVEIRKARFENINFEEGIWIIPAEIMKARRDHIVPLSRQAMEVLEAQRLEVEVLNTPWVFPSQHKPINPMSDGTVNKAIQRLGYGKEIVAHGFRALARTTIREKLGYDSEVIERQLAHKASGPLGEAYDRTQFLDERKRMMDNWASYIDALASDGKVVHAKFEKKVS